MTLSPAVPRRTFLTGATSLAFLATTTPTWSAPDPLVLEVGWHTPETIDLPAHITTYEDRCPWFDGLILDPLSVTGIATGRRDTNVHLGWLAYGPTPLDPRQYTVSLDALARTHFVTFTHNLLKLTTRAATQDLFAPTWSTTTLPNMEWLARMARQTGCQGLWVDTEAYPGGQPFSYPYQRTRTANPRPFADYQQRSRALGVQVMQAWQRGFPGLEVLLTMGYPKAYASGPLDTSAYGLLPAWLDGLLDASAGPVYDGYEQSYGFSRASQFQAVLDGWNVRAWSQSSQRHQYQPSFGLWLDYGSPWRGWSNANVSSNYFPPATWQRAVQAACAATARYVWIYTEAAHWWDGSLPGAYRTAMAKGTS